MCCGVRDPLANVHCRLVTFTTATFSPSSVFVLSPFSSRLPEKGEKCTLGQVKCRMRKGERGGVFLRLCRLTHEQFVLFREDEESFHLSSSKSVLASKSTGGKVAFFSWKIPWRPLFEGLQHESFLSTWHPQKRGRRRSAHTGRGGETQCRLSISSSSDPNSSSRRPTDEITL